jgi:hypothetical protein
MPAKAGIHAYVPQAKAWMPSMHCHDGSDTGEELIIPAVDLTLLAVTI